MAGQRQPISLIEHKGKAHFTKEQIEERKCSEVQADADNIAPPDYLTEKQAGEFSALSDELKRCEIMTNLDCDALARFVVARSDYAEYVKLVRSIPKTVDNLQELKEADKLKRGAFLDCNTAAKELGMTISSRCKLVVPKKEESKPINKFAVIQSG